MKNTKIPLTCFLVLAVVMAFSACKKSEIRGIEKAGAKLIGTWQVNEINVHITDTMGNLLKDSSLTNQGTVSFAFGDKNAQGGDYFDHADFTGACSTSDLVLYFRNVAAGDAIGGGGWQLYWDADPDDMRVQFWGETGGGSYHRSINHSYDGDNNQQLYYIVQPPYLNKRIFYTWKMSK